MKPKVDSTRSAASSESHRRVEAPPAQTSRITSVGTTGSPPRVASAFLKKISASGAGSQST